MAEEQKQFQCSGDCLNCRPVSERKVQWQYCAAQFTYNSMRMLQSMQDSIKALGNSISVLETKIHAIQDNEALVYNPNKEEKSELPINPIAQKGDGAKE